MSKKLKRQIPADGVLNEQTIDKMVEELMNFPGWNGHRIDEWIDTVTLGLSPNNSIPHFRSAEEESFVIEISNSNLFLTKPPLIMRLVQKIAQVNRRSQERIGRPLLTLVFS